MTDWKLCYVEGNFAWFTSGDVACVTGDDWDDAPYEHNAGEPYEWNEHRKVPKYELLKVAFEPGYMKRTGFAYSNSPYSVDMINRGDVAWLNPYTKTRPIFAGCSLREFVSLVQEAEGEVYIPLSKEKDKSLFVCIVCCGNGWVADESGLDKQQCPNCCGTTDIYVVRETIDLYTR